MQAAGIDKRNRKGSAWRLLATTLVAADLVMLILNQSVLNYRFGLNAITAARLDLNLLLGLSFLYFVIPKAAGGSEDRVSEIAASDHVATSPPGDKTLLWFIAAYALVLLTVTTFTSSSGDLLINIKHTLLAILPMFAFGYVCPRIMRRDNYVAIFLILLAIFSAHTLLTIWLCLTNTHSFLGRDITCLVGRAQYVFGQRGQLVTGLTWNPNTLAASLLMLPAIAVETEAIVSAEWLKKMVCASRFLTASHTILTLSRGAILSLVVSFGVWGMLDRMRPRFIRAVCKLGLLAGAGFAVWQLLAWRGDKSSYERMEVLQDSLTKIACHPWGMGLPPVGSEQLPHNLILGTTIYFGPIATVLLGLILGWLLYEAIGGRRADSGEKRRGLASYRMKSARRLLLASLIAMVAVHGAVEYCIGHPTLFANSLFWLLVGYAAYGRD
ncbi:MAG: hypothetical protein HY986_11630 [Candidatus Melainabacteria bacterium]|nr:hypothetical protein [Candidatus Melainabacteria bacterium]